MASSKEMAKTGMVVLRLSHARYSPHLRESPESGWSPVGGELQFSQQWASEISRGNVVEREYRNQRRAQMKEENDDDEADNDRFFEQVALQCVYGFLNESEVVCGGGAASDVTQVSRGLLQ